MTRVNNAAVVGEKLLLLVAVLTLLGGVLFTQSQRGESETVDLVLGTATVAVQVLDTEALRVRGLSGKKSLPANAGKLFVFSQDSEWGIWMKKMNFPIDIIWLDSQGRVVFIKERATPESYPEVFLPPSPARYVVEVNAGKAAEWDLVVGMMVPELAEEQWWLRGK